MDLASRLKTTRKRRGLSQSALARATGVSQPTIANWERGGHVPRKDALARIANALSADPTWLLSGVLPDSRNPAHLHLAMPIHHIPVYEWPLGAAEPATGQPARYISIAMDAGGVFGLDVGEAQSFAPGTVALFSRDDRRQPGRFLRIADGCYALDRCGSEAGSLDDVFARLIYTVVPH